MRLTPARIGAAVGALLAASASMAARASFPTRGMAVPQDKGPLTPQRSARPVTVTLPLKLRDAAAAESMLASVTDKTSQNQHQFLTPGQFKAQFAQSDADVGVIAAHLTAYGLDAQRTGANTSIHRDR